MKDSEVLKKVKKQIENQRHIYICNALQDVAAPSWQKYSLRRWVQYMLGRHHTYQDWLAASHRKVWRNMIFENYRQARLQWLDWMIAECEKAEAKENKQCKPRTNQTRSA